MAETAPMPYVILIVGLLIGFYALYRFFTTASVAQVRAFFKGAFFVVMSVIMAFMAFTGRFGPAVAILIMLMVIGWPYIRQKFKIQPEHSKPTGGDMDRAEALKILGVEEGATAEQIQDAYKRLMTKVHPDNEGSDWMAAKLNQARDLLLK